MRKMLPLVLIGLLCTACGEAQQRTDASRKDWFNTYQTDRTCQYIHATHEDIFLKGPTGRAHPF